MPPSQLFRSPLRRAFAPVARCCVRSHRQSSSPSQLLNSPFRKYLHNTVNTSARQSTHGRALRRRHNSTGSPAPSLCSSASARPTPRGPLFGPRRFNSTGNSPSKTPSFSQRWRKLSREYGWAALGIYLLLSALDFPFCFAAVRLLGVERIGHYEHVIVESTKRIFGPIWPRSEESDRNGDDASDDLAMVDSVEDTSYNDHGVAEAQKRNAGEGASTYFLPQSSP